MTPAQQEEHAKFAMMGLALMRRDDKTREEKLDFFRTMEGRYPGVGWGREGASLKRFWEREGKSHHCQFPPETVDCVGLPE